MSRKKRLWLACTTICLLLIVAGILTHYFRHRYDADWDPLKSQAVAILHAAPGYSRQPAYLDGLLESRHTGMRRGIRGKAIAQAYIPTLFLFMEQDADAAHNRQAVATLDFIVTKLFRHSYDPATQPVADASYFADLPSPPGKNDEPPTTQPIPDFQQNADMVVRETEEGPNVFRCIWYGFSYPADRMVEIDIHFDTGNLHRDDSLDGQENGKWEKDTLLYGQWDPDQKKVIYLGTTSVLLNPPVPGQHPQHTVVGDDDEGEWARFHKGDPDFDQLAKDLWNGTLFIKVDSKEDLDSRQWQHGDVMLKVKFN